ncbi:MAG: KamA family radical SAM protein [Calditrichaeota bacterium]|nr:MAG: KamA family radical SAM protein [Calditrichota bacterium]
MEKYFTDVSEFVDYLELPSELKSRAEQASQKFSFKVTKEFASRIEKGNPKDPLLLQVLPTESELLEKKGFVSDPVGDRNASKRAGLLQKYKGRVLLVITGSCAINCRYCFRREFNYKQVPKTTESIEGNLRLIEEDNSVEEVILSGGDPLMWKNMELEKLFKRIAKIKHIKRLRIHTRLPIVNAKRIDSGLINLLSKVNLVIYFVIHSNSCNELSPLVIGALKRIKSVGIPVLNQMVLLKGINDSVEEMEKFLRLQINNHIQPYYLHQLDKVNGATHFFVPVSKGRKLISELRKRLPGYAIPKYVYEKKGFTSKFPL